MLQADTLAERALEEESHAASGLREGLADAEQSRVAITANGSEHQVRQAIDNQLLKLERDTDITANSDLLIAQRWEFTNWIFGLMAVFLSGVITVLGAVSDGLWKVEPDQVRAITTVLAAVVTVVGSVLTFLKPAEQAERYREFGNKQKTLRNRIRIYRAAVMPQEKSLASITDRLVKLGQEKDSLSSENPPVSNSAFLKAKKRRAQKASDKPT